ncbi:hypothetical protein VZG28_14335 [Synechococcus elongatus IITB4]|uniref:hypothetical protein n=1 Tax=Synechococcus elongatus TaxID=32046 RepID=UPI0030D5B0B1
MKRGVACEVVDTIVNDLSGSSLERQLISEGINKYLTFQSSNRFEDDVKEISENIDRIKIPINSKEEIKKSLEEIKRKIDVYNKWPRQLQRNLKEQFFLLGSTSVKDEGMELVIIALILTLALATVYVVVNNPKEPQSRKGKQQSNRNIYHPTPKQEGVLCLVVPLMEVQGLRKGLSVKGEVIKHLIDSAPYFLCTSTEKANNIERSLAMSDVAFSDRQDTFIRIKLLDAGSMLEKNVKYSLKKGISNEHEGFVENIALLKNLSGLESFVRV